MPSKLPVILLAALSVVFAIAEISFVDCVRDLLGPQADLVPVWSANQGVYNLFLALGLVWAAICPDPKFKFQLSIFFLGCIAVAGVVGACTTETWILLAGQTLTAAVAIGFVCYSHFRSHSPS